MGDRPGLPGIAVENAAAAAAATVAANGGLSMWGFSINLDNFKCSQCS